MISVVRTLRLGASRLARAAPSRTRAYISAAASADGGICIVGGGFGGLNTALKLAALPWEGARRPKITLIDRSDRHVFLPMLYDLTCGDVSEWEVAPRFDELLAGSGVEHLQAELTGLDPDAHELVVKGSDGEQRIAYEKLVLAIGAQPVKPPLNGAMTFRTLDDALDLRFKLRALLASGTPLIRVVIVGASYSGIELATNLASTLGPRRGLVTLVGRADAVLKAGAKGSQQASLDALTRAGVEVLLNRDVQLDGPGRARLTHVGARAAAASAEASESGAGEEGGGPAEEAEAAGAEFIDADLVIWCAGSAPIARTAELQLALAADGRIATTSSLRVREQEDVYAIGDMAFCEPLSGTDANAQNAQVAVQQSDYASYNVWASLNGKEPMAFRYLKLGEMLAFGPTDASVSAFSTVNIRGLPGAAIRRAAYLYRMPTNTHRAKVGFSWALDAALRSADLLIGKAQQKSTPTI